MARELPPRSGEVVPIAPSSRSALYEDARLAVVISLTAGGTGLNLTAADQVFTSIRLVPACGGAR